MDLEQALIKAHLIQERVARVNMGVSLSIGIAPMETGRSLEFNAYQADIAMYTAKRIVINNLNRANAVKLVTEEARLIAWKDFNKTAVEVSLAREKTFMVGFIGKRFE